MSNMQEPDGFEANVKWNGKWGFLPIHKPVNKWSFPGNERREELEANLADAVSRVGELNGLTVGDVHQLFPAILRMLKSKSEWSGNEK